MPSMEPSLILVTAIAPSLWGTTYLVTTELLPPGRPLLAAVIRALPAGLLLVAITRRLPQGIWWWRAFVLGALNIGVFFALLFVAAYRLPGGVAATVGALQPLLVAVLSTGLLAERLSTRKLLAAIAGVAGVSVAATAAPVPCARARAGAAPPAGPPGRGPAARAASSGGHRRTGRRPPSSGEPRRP